MKRYQDAFNPATGEIIGNSELHDLNDLASMLKLAREAQKLWEEFSVYERVKWIKRIRKFLIDNSDRIAETISKSNGKTKIDALATEVMPAAMALTYYCKNAPKFLRDQKLKAGNIILLNKRSKLIKTPFGIIGIISPNNYPFAIPFSEVIIGLLAGNVVILKTAKEALLVGAILKEAIDSVQLPPGVFQLINLPGKIAGDAFIESGMDKIFFTGSVQVGKYLYEKAAKYLTPVCLELGGNDAMIVCEDADPYRAAVGALWAGFQNAGQSCGGVERIYVHQKIYDEFMAILKEKINSLRVNYFEDYDSDMGCMTTESQIRTVANHVEDAIAKGAKIFAQSKIPDKPNLKNFYPATVLTDVNHDMILMKEETFGPVVGVMKFENYDDAIKLTNDSDLGLTGSVWTKSNIRGETIARQIKAGVVTINDHLMSHGLPETPWGGFKNSGIGRTHGKIGFDEMTQLTVIVKDVLPLVKKNLWWHPYSKDLYDALKGTTDFLYSDKFLIKIKGCIAFLKVFPRMFNKK